VNESIDLVTESLIVSQSTLFDSYIDRTINYTMDDFLVKKRPVPVLKQDNHERWFKLLKRYFKRKGLWPAVVNAPMTDIEGLDRADAKA
jgi:hypothetical protein